MEKENQTVSVSEQAADGAEEAVKADGGADTPTEANSTEERKAANSADTPTETEGGTGDSPVSGGAETADGAAAAENSATASAAARTGAQTGSTRTAKKRASANTRASSSARNSGGARAAGNTRASGSTRDKVLQSWIDEMPDGSAKHYLESRVLPQMKWYAEKSRTYKNRYQILMSVAIALGALIPVFSVFSGGGNFMKAWIALLGSAVTAVNALLSLHNYKDLWLTYRNAREDLLRTLYYYFNNAGVFEGDDPQEKKDTLLVKACEDRMGQENGGWKSLLDK